MFKKKLFMRSSVIFFVSVYPFAGLGASSYGDDWEASMAAEERGSPLYRRNDPFLLALRIEEKKRKDVYAKGVAANKLGHEVLKAKLRSEDKDRQTLLDIDARNRREKGAQRQRRKEEEAIMARAWHIIDLKREEDLTLSERTVFTTGKMTGVLAQSIIQTEEDQKRKKAARQQQEEADAREEAQKRHEKEVQKRKDTELKGKALAILKKMNDEGHFKELRRRQEEVEAMLKSHSIPTRALAEQIVEEQKIIDKAVKILRVNREGGRYSEEELKGVHVLLVPTDQRMILTYDLANRIVRSQEKAEERSLRKDFNEAHRYNLDEIDRLTRHEPLFGAPNPTQKKKVSENAALSDSLEDPVVKARKPKGVVRLERKPEYALEEAWKTREVELHKQFSVPNRAQSVEGDLFHDKALSETHDSRALEWMTQAAQWNAEARFDLALWYAKGKKDVVDQDLNQALFWYEVGGLLNDHLKCQYNLAVIYRENRDYQDSEKYIYWLKRAAFDTDGRIPSKTAQFRLGEAYEKGYEGTLPVCVEEALKWYRKSASRGNSDAVDAIKRLER